MPSPERDAIVQMLRSIPKQVPTRENVALLRTFLDTMSAPAPRDTGLASVDAGGVPAEWVRCGDVDPDRRLLYLHGGAYISGSRLSHRAIAARLGRAAGAAVLLIDYRLAPEHPHPAAVEDAVAVTRWIHEQGPGGPGRARHVLFAGDSAGGGLALATLLALKAAGAPMPSAVATLSAWTDLAMTGESFGSRAAVDPMITAAYMHPSAALYLGSSSPEVPTASPLYGDLAGLPPIYMQVGDLEVLLDDTTRFAERARAAGVDATAEVWPGMFHVFQLFGGALPEAREAVAKLGAFLRERSP